MTENARLSTCGTCGRTIRQRPGGGWEHASGYSTTAHRAEPDDSAVSGPGRDDLPTCNACHHPEHAEGECEEEVSTGRYGTDGVLVTTYCACTGPVPTGPELSAVAPDPWMDPDAAAAHQPPPF